MDISVLLLGAWIGFIWGEWWADRKAKKSRNPDPAMTLIYGMLSEILEKRKFVGPDTKIGRYQNFEYQGQRYKLILQSEHDWEDTPHG